MVDYYPHNLIFVNILLFIQALVVGISVIVVSFICIPFKTFI
jgi:hypothetical protein